MESRSGVVLLVGGAGYVGSVLVSELLERGYAVRVFDRLYYGDQGLAPARDRIELVVGDMRQMDPAVQERPDGTIRTTDSVLGAPRARSRTRSTWPSDIVSLLKRLMGMDAFDQRCSHENQHKRTRI